MRYVVTWNQTKIKVQLPDQVPDGQPFRFRVGDRDYQGTWIRRHAILSVIEGAAEQGDAAAPGVERLLRVRAQQTTRFDGDPDTELRAEIEAGPRVRQMAATVAFDMPGQAARAAASREQIVRSQITGKVLKVLVSPGDTVGAGQALLTIEAMKMENRVFAAAAGTVLSVHVKDGDAVATGKELLRIAP